MPSLGGIDFFNWRSGADASQPANVHQEYFQTPGFDGVGRHYRGRYGELYVVIGRGYFLTAELMKSWLLSAMALEGTVVTRVDNAGLSWPSQEVVTVKPREPFPIVGHPSVTIGIDVEVSLRDAS